MKTNRILKANRLLRRQMPHRRGFTTPAVAVALLVMMAGLALIVDRLWLDTADLELTTAAEAAALAAASELVGDDLLKTSSDPERRAELALTAAAFVAGQNLVAGSPVVLNTNPLGDVRFGQLAFNTESQLVQFQETNVAPTTAVVTARRSRVTGNPVSLFVAGLTQLPFGDVAARVEATVDNRVTGVRPLEGVTVPAMPLAILWNDPAGLRTDTWYAQIESRSGADNYGYDPIAHQVLSSPDGIPEMVLHSQLDGQQITDTNITVLDIGTGLNDEELGRQFASGWTVEDLAGLGGEFLLPLGSSQTLPASGELRNADRNGLDTVIGQPRICLLYSAVTPTGNSKTGQATCIRLVAVRVLAVTDLSNNGCQVIVQPCVVKTRTAVLNEMSPYYTAVDTAGTPGTLTDGTATSTTADTVADSLNPYIYKLRLSH